MGPVALRPRLTTGLPLSKHWNFVAPTKRFAFKPRRFTPSGDARYVIRAATEFFCCRLHLIRLTRPCAGCRAREASRMAEVVACVARASKYKKNGCRNMSEPYDSERVFLSRGAARLDCDWRQRRENMGNSSVFLLAGTTPAHSFTAGATPANATSGRALGKLQSHAHPAVKLRRDVLSPVSPHVDTTASRPR